jgi:4-hydroxy-3-methylbut-2-enyl diphosphate reductase
MEITIDKNSGYCFGVEYAIQMAEDYLKEDQPLYCLGDIVHNSMEVKRLGDLGLQVITHQELETMHNCRVLIRAHGEPPSTYELALKNNIELIDASCPVVLKLQNRVKHAYDKINKVGGQIVIYGQNGHAEVTGITGQTNNEAIIVSNEADLAKIDFTKPVELFSQTTKSTKGFYHIAELIEEKVKENFCDNNSNSTVASFEANDSICRQVSNREPQLRKFAAEHDVIIFVSGKKSSNGKALYAVCKEVNTNSFFIESEAELDESWFIGHNTVGICGATSTPNWLMEQVSNAIEESRLLV